MWGRVWLSGLLFVAACGEVNEDLPDAPTSDANGDALVDSPPAAPGTVRTARSLSALSGTGIAAGPAGLVVTGYISAPTDLGGGPLIAVGGYDLAVAGFTLDSTHLYSVRHGDADGEFAWTRATDGNGNPLVYGVYGSMSTANLGLGPVTGGGLTDGYVGRYGAGAPAWVHRLVGPGEDKMLASGRGPGNTMLAGGYFEATTNWNGGTLTSAGGRDAMFAQFNTATGAVMLTKVYPNLGRGEVSGFAMAGNDIIVSGMFDDTITFGGTSTLLTSAGQLDAFIAKVDTSGNGIWGVRFGGTMEDRSPVVVVDSAGDIYVAGTFIGQIAFGAINLIGPGMTENYIAKLRGTDGGVLWAVQLSSTGVDNINDIALDGNGHVTVVGSVGGPIDGGTSLGGTDSVIASFDCTNGSSYFRQVFSTAGGDGAWGLVYAGNGDLYAGVRLGGAYDFGVPLDGPPAPSGVLLRIAP